MKYNENIISEKEEINVSKIHRILFVEYRQIILQKLCILYTFTF